MNYLNESFSDFLNESNGTKVNAMSQHSANKLLMDKVYELEIDDKKVSKMVYDILNNIAHMKADTIEEIVGDYIKSSKINSKSIKKINDFMSDHFFGYDSVFEEESWETKHKQVYFRGIRSMIKRDVKFGAEDYVQGYLNSHNVDRLEDLDVDGAMKLNIELQKYLRTAQRLMKSREVITEITGMLKYPEISSYVDELLDRKKKTTIENLDYSDLMDLVIQVREYNPMKPNNWDPYKKKEEFNPYDFIRRPGSNWTGD